MALLSLDEETRRARPGKAFANGFEWDAWSGMWCADCIHEQDCPLVIVAFLTKVTPAAWEERDLRALNRYTCREFEAVKTEETS